MANTRIQIVVQQWVIDNHLKPKYGKNFSEKNIPLSWGGKFKFDAVSDDGEIIANISTSPSHTARKKKATGKIHKIRSDTLYLTNAVGPKKRIQVFTEQSMYDDFTKQTKAGRYPNNVELDVVKLPNRLQEQVEAARKKAEDEVTPKESRK